MSNPVMWFEIAGKNADELCEFYRTVFEWEISPEKSGIYLCETGSDEGIKGHIFPTTDEMPYTNQITFYISVNDLNEAVKNVKSHGGKILIPPQEIPDNMGSFAMFIDPSGNILGLHQQ